MHVIDLIEKYGSLWINISQMALKKSVVFKVLVFSKWHEFQLIFHAQQLKKMIKRNLLKRAKLLKSTRSHVNSKN